MNLKNINTAFKESEIKYVALASFLAMMLIFAYFTHYDLILGNFGLIYALSQVIIQFLVSLLFALNTSLLYYKMNYIGGLSIQGTSGSFGGLLSLLVSGCPACSITLAGYLGLATFFSSLPLAGLEVKIIALLILLWSVNEVSNNLMICNIKKN